jgi:elongator complex protein 4
MSSFKKRVGGQKVSIKLPLGSKLSTQNGQLLISSGISSLDEVLGGGLPVGSLNLVLEDQFTNYSSYLLKYFLAQGVSNSQPACLIGGEDRFWSNLPGIYHYDRIQATTPPKEQEPKKEESDDLKIAWRYKNLPNLNNINSDSEKCKFNYYTKLFYY